MKFRIPLLLFLFFNLSVFSQQALQVIDLSNIDYSKIESLFYLKLNKLREEQTCSKLFPDATLKLAANDQAAYMHSVNKVCHDQTIKGKESPQNRVVYYKGTHDLVGENCIEIILKKPMKTKYNNNPIIVDTYEQAAEALYLGWKNSPGHYKNMVTPVYDVSGLGFFFSADSSSLFCTQVFSTIPYIQPKGLESPIDSYGIMPKDKKRCACFESVEYQNLVPTLTFINGSDSIYLKSEDLSALKRFFNKPTDAIYFDVVLREQFVCSKNNLLHGSEVYDGTMLKPIYFKDIYKKNKASGNKNFYAPLCAIPEKFEKYKYQINYGFVKENVFCKYVWQIDVPRENLKVLELIPKWMELEHETIPADSFEGQLSFNIPFERGKTELSEKQRSNLINKLKIYKPFLKDISIKTFSSIEGNSDFNISLQRHRAEILKNEIQKVTGKLSNIEIESKENWDDFYSQIQSGKYRYMKSLSKENLKETLKTKSVLDSLDYILRKTRIARITVQLEAIVNDNSHPQIILAAYKKAVEGGDSLKSFQYQNKLLHSIFKKQLTNTDVIEVDLPFERKFLPHWTNFIALSTFDPELIYSSEVREKALKAMSIDTTFRPLQFNMCIMTLKFVGDYMDTIMSIKQLENKMKASYLMKNKEDSLLVKKMWLNYHILSAYHHWLSYEFDKINPSLLYIRNNFASQKLNETEAIKLGLLFNFYGRNSWTIDLLQPYLEKTKNEDLQFLFVETYPTTYQTSLSDQVWIGNLKKAKNMNVNRFYHWVVDANFQLMRMPEIKNEFCTINKSGLK